MKLICMMAATAWMWYGCGAAERRLGKALTDPANGAVQEKEVNGYRFRLSYLPEPGQQEERCFRLNVQLPPDMTHNRESESLQASFGVDTLFKMIAGADTLAPLQVMRIANGNIGGLEYMLIFSRKGPLKDSAAIGFSDRLFSNNYLEFPVRFSVLDKIDSLSSRI